MRLGPQGRARVRGCEGLQLVIELSKDMGFSPLMRKCSQRRAHKFVASANPRHSAAMSTGCRPRRRISEVVGKAKAGGGSTTVAREEPPVEGPAGMMRPHEVDAAWRALLEETLTPGQARRADGNVRGGERS